jgi:hypothetical protein
VTQKTTSDGVRWIGLVSAWEETERVPMLFTVVMGQTMNRVVTLRLKTQPPTAPGGTNCGGS